MFIVILFIFLGIALGYTLRNRLASKVGVISALNGRFTTWLIWLLLFMLGLEVDTTLPIITQTVGQRYVALSIYHGFVTDFTVPFVVTMWCTLA